MCAGAFDESQIGGAVANRGDCVVAVGGGQNHVGGDAAAPGGGGLRGYQPAGHELFGDRLAGHHLGLLAPLGSQRTQAGVDVVGDIEQVSEVYSTSGQYDLLMKCYLPPDMDIGHFVVEKLQTLPGIKDTFTVMAYKAFSEDRSY